MYETPFFYCNFDDEEMEVTVKYTGKETITTALDKKEGYKLALLVKNYNGLKDGLNDNLPYLTPDAKKVPVYAKSKIAVGNGELKITSVTGLNY